MLTDRNLVLERPHLTGVQRLYRNGGYGLSLVNYAAMLHHYSFAWEAAVLVFPDDSNKYRPTYDTPLTSDVEVFSTEEEANAFIEKALDWFGTNQP